MTEPKSKRSSADDFIDTHGDEVLLKAFTEDSSGNFFIEILNSVRCSKNAKNQALLFLLEAEQRDGENKELVKKLVESLIADGARYDFGPDKEAVKYSKYFAAAIAGVGVVAAVILGAVGVASIYGALSAAPVVIAPVFKIFATMVNVLDKLPWLQALNNILGVAGQALAAGFASLVTLGVTSALALGAMFYGSRRNQAIESKEKYYKEALRKIGLEENIKKTGSSKLRAGTASTKSVIEALGKSVKGELSSKRSVKEESSGLNADNSALEEVVEEQEGYDDDQSLGGGGPSGRV